MSYNFLFNIFLILMLTKIFSLVSKKMNMPAIVGALASGIILGPACFNVLHETEFLIQLSELGVIVMMFTAGLEVDIHELKKSGKASFFIALLGVIVPLLMGTILATCFNIPKNIFDLSDMQVLKNIFLGVIFTATSVSITVETLKELGKLTTRVGNVVLGAALIDDILGIIALTIITSLASPTAPNPLIVIFKIIMFFVLSIVIYNLLSDRLTKWMDKSEKGLRRYTILSFSLCLLLAFVAEKYFGVADITGAFIAGIILSNSSKSFYLDRRFSILSYMLLSPVFFASIGLKVSFAGLNSSLILFTVLVVIVSMISKVIGCGLAAKMFKFDNKEALQIGTSMMTRGEVALIVANKGAEVGLMTNAYFAPIIIMIICCALFAPILLKKLFS